MRIDTHAIITARLWELDQFALVVVVVVVAYARVPRECVPRIVRCQRTVRASALFDTARNGITELLSNI